jgi:glycosyltransferase involved in cell wall biosynthesis
MKLNILNLISGLGQGGAEQILFDFSTEFKKYEFIKSSIVSFSDETILLPKFENDDIDIEVLYKEKTFLDLLKIIAAISEHIKKQEIEIVHAHMSHAMIVAAILKIRFPRLKIVFTPHSIHFGNRLREILIFLLKPFRDVDIIFSQDMKQWFNKDRYVVIPNGIRVDDFDINIDKYKKFTFIAVGNIKEAKNYPFLINCANELKNKFDFQLFIVGEGKDRERLQKQVQDLGLEDIVYLKGSQSDISGLLNSSHCLVMPSLWEGMPLAILEAGASKLPVISTPVGAIPSIIDEDNGYMTELDGFCAMMEYVYEHYDEATQKAKKLQTKIIEEYSIESVAKKHEKLYEQLAQGI